MYNAGPTSGSGLIFFGEILLGFYGLISFINNWLHSAIHSSSYDKHTSAKIYLRAYIVVTRSVMYAVWGIRPSVRLSDLNFISYKVRGLTFHSTAIAIFIFVLLESMISNLRDHDQIFIKITFDFFTPPPPQSRGGGYYHHHVWPSVCASVFRFRTISRKPLAGLFLYCKHTFLALGCIDVPFEGYDLLPIFNL